MCGICGMVGDNDVKKLEAMTNVMAHRGPDDAGIYVSNKGQPVGLGNRRLSIIDLSEAGHQPMCNEDGTVWLSHNGEIYNYRELRQELVERGHVFRSNTDTETILHLYEEYGLELCKKLVGMFAFALWDEGKQRLFLARDRLGIKPLYYTLTSTGIVFSSEIKPILQSGAVVPEVDLDALNYYLTFLWVPGPLTMFKGIRKLLPGHYLVWQDGQLSITQYWDLQPMAAGSDTRSEAEICEELLCRFSKAVERRMISDVPLGAFLSGGLDSSAVVAMMTGLSENCVDTYTMGLSDDDRVFDRQPPDIYYARLFAETFGEKINYHESFVRPDIVSLLPKVIWHLEEPIADPAAITAYLICKWAKDAGDTVLLSGMGGDEVFAGYSRHVAGAFLEGPGNLIAGLLPSVLKIIPTHFYAERSNVLMPYLRYLRRISKHLDLPGDRRYVGISSWLADGERLRLLKDDVRDSCKGMDVRDIHLAHMKKFDGADPLSRMQYVDIKTFLVDLNLTYTDKMSMAVSTEVRVPFLDHELVEFAFAMSPKFRLNRTTRKFIIKQAFRDILPKAILHRGKTGFGPSARAWIMRDLRPMIKDLLSPERLNHNDYFDSTGVWETIQANWEGRGDYSLVVWALLTFEIWYGMFMEGKSWQDWHI